VLVPAARKGALQYLSCGRPIDGIDVRIVPADGATEIHESLRPSVGEIEVRGGYVFAGYFRNDAATKAAFVQGWYRTGDLGFFVDGELYICGRKKDLLIVHGRNYYAHDIEAIAGEVPNVRPGRVVAFGMDDLDTGSEEAIILLETASANPGQEQELRRAVKEAIFDRMELTVRSVVIVPSGSLIKTTSGKPSRVQNKSRYALSRAEARP